MNIRCCWIIVFCLLLSGCLQEDENFPKMGTPLLVSPVLVATGPITKSSTYTTLSEGSSIGVFLAANNNYTAQKVRYDYSSGKWVANPTDIYLNSNTATVCAYYPYDYITTTNPASVTLTSQLYDGSKDLCYAKSVTAPSNKAPGINFTMSHAYSQITFTLTRGAYSGPGAVSQIQIANPGILSTNTLDITNGVYGSGTKGTVSFNPGISGIAPDASVNTSVLMVPVTTRMSDNLTFTYKVDDTDMTATLPLNSNTLQTLDAGKNYNVYINLKYSPESNCYMVKPGGTVYIPISRVNKGWAKAGLGVAIGQGENWNAGLLWSDNTDVIESIKTNKEYIIVTVGRKNGNAVVYAKVDNDIVWSWHVWVTDYDPNNGGTTYTYNNGTTSHVFMDRNLGANSVIPGNNDAVGLYYQWGRKDPFSGNISDNYFRAMTVDASENLSHTIKYPWIFYCGTANNHYDWFSCCDDKHKDDLWGGENANTMSAKTVFDPCPAGWRVPAWQNNVSPWQGLPNVVSYNQGGVFFSNMGYYPVSGYYFEPNYIPWSGGENLSSIYRSGGLFWSATANDDDNDKEAHDLYLHYYDNWYWDVMTTVKTEDASHRAAGFNVRCVKE